MPILMMNTIIVWMALIYGTAWLGDGVNSFPQTINFKLNNTVHCIPIELNIL
jgi:hypothetical protein